MITTPLCCSILCVTCALISTEHDHSSSVPLHPLFHVPLRAVHQASLVFLLQRCADSLSLVNYSQCIHSFLLNFAFQYFPISCNILIFIILSHCFSKCGLVGRGRLAVHVNNCVVVWNIYKMMYWKWMIEGKKSLAHLTHKELLWERNSFLFIWIYENKSGTDVQNTLALWSGGFLDKKTKKVVTVCWSWR